MQPLTEIAAGSNRWLVRAALPLWARSGFDEGCGAFEEQLDFSGAPVSDVPLRVMVQARQVAVFAAAALSGRYREGAAPALRAAHAMCATYLEADGAPGWAFSVDRAGRVVDGRRDLYAHAFVLFALAWALRLEAAPSFEAAITATLRFLDGAFADPAHGGYWDCLPRPDGLRRQNPHMHLFEALLALAETTGRADILERCRHLHRLVRARFLQGSTGMLPEYFEEDWRVHPAPGAGSVEPGHLFEWAWLLRRYQALSGEDQGDAVTALLDTAIRCGLDAEHGRIVDEIGEDGQVRRSSSRSWPHAEALKALTAESALGNRRHDALIAPFLLRLQTVYCPPALNGGWIDHVDTADRPISTAMPASTLYHLYFGITAVEDWLERDGRRLEQSEA